MTKYAFIYGTIAGIIISIIMNISMHSYNNSSSASKAATVDYGLLIGYGTMLAAFSMVFVGVKNYRVKKTNGTITLGKAFLMGLYMIFIASTIYVISWMIDLYCFMPYFMDKYAAHMLEKAQSAHLSADQLEAQIKEIDLYKEWYKRPVMVVLLTYSEILPLGILVAFISALVFKKKPTIVSVV